MKTGQIVTIGLLGSATLVVGGLAVKDITAEEKNWPMIALKGFGALALGFATIAALKSARATAGK